MAIVSQYRKPDFFITMTCNPKWSEITDHLLDGETAQDRPDIVSRVFKLKKDQFMDDLKTGKLLGLEEQQMARESPLYYQAGMEGRSR